jgi:flagellar hook-length control protein FliK
MIEQLLFETNIKPTIKASIKNESFLLSLLKETKEPKELLKSLNIKIADLEEIVKKLPKDKQEELKNILKDLKLSDDENTINLKQNTSLPIFQPQISKKDLQNKSLKNESKIVEFIKKEITAKIKSKEIILSKAKINEFKQIKTLKELINFSNKNGLNIQKIIYKEIENKINVIQKPIKEPPAKIIINNEIKDKHQIKNKITQHNKTQKNDIFTKTHTNIQEKNHINKLLNREAKTDIQKILQNKYKPHKKPIINKFNNKSNNQQKINEIHLKNNEKEQITKSFISQLLNDNTHSKNNKNTDIQHLSKQEIKTKEIKNEPHYYNQVELNTSTQIITELKQNITKAKESIKHFAKNLKEAIEEYKPPIHKLSIELHPKELGKVEVTLLHRGDNLQIQINSNQPSTINFFNTHQNELKNILVNMGYNEVNMSFNSNQHQQQKQQYKQNQKTFSSKEEDGFIIEIPYKYA